MFGLSQTQLIVAGCLLLALPFWVMGLWRAANVIHSRETPSTWRLPRVDLSTMTPRLKLFLAGTLI
jgi:hypothetical protein